MERPTIRHFSRALQRGAVRLTIAHDFQKGAEMKTTLARTFGVAFSIALAGGSYLATAQQPPAGPPPPMSFFVTSAGSGKGAELGGIAGADRICQTLATAAGSTKTWHAYLS